VRQSGRPRPANRLGAAASTRTRPLPLPPGLGRLARAVLIGRARTAGPSTGLWRDLNRAVGSVALRPWRARCCGVVCRSRELTNAPVLDAIDLYWPPRRGGFVTSARRAQTSSMTTRARRSDRREQDDHGGANALRDGDAAQSSRREAGQLGRPRGPVLPDAPLAVVGEKLLAALAKMDDPNAEPGTDFSHR
jgi:hypothetical protein